MAQHLGARAFWSVRRPMAGQARGRSGQWRTRGHRQHASSEMPVRCGARPLALLLLLLVVHALATARTAAQQHHVNHRQEEQQHYSASLQLSSATTTSAWASRSGGPWPLVEDAPAGGATGEAQARELLVGTDSCLALQATTVRELVSRCGCVTPRKWQRSARGSPAVRRLLPERWQQRAVV